MKRITGKIFGILASGAIALGAAPAQAADDKNAPGTEAGAVATAERPSFTAASEKLSGPIDTNYKALHAAWKRIELKAEPAPVEIAVSIPSGGPVRSLSLTSSFGNRSDPFTGRRRAHNGIDIPGAVGTPIYATADGRVEMAKWNGGYGNYVELSHSNDIETRYGHMSRLNVREGQFVKRGQVIGFMGSTGRSTGSHLHYEVRIEGEPVNPMPFIETGGVELALAAQAGQGGSGE